jgi:rare lipoprotein A
MREIFLAGLLGLAFGAVPFLVVATAQPKAPAPTGDHFRDVTEITEPERFPAKATWYGMRYHGRRTASGEKFDTNGLTAAHPTLPFGTVLRVTWLDRAVIVRITDRPAPGVDVLDLSAAAFRELAPHRIGVLHVVCEVIQ